jgi:hypothetical protein
LTMILFRILNLLKRWLKMKEVKYGKSWKRLSLNILFFAISLMSKPPKLDPDIAAIMDL